MTSPTNKKIESAKSWIQCSETEPEMLIVDGSFGEGGGQILRTSLTLALCLNRPVRIENIRAGRKKPGLLRQHLCCVRAAQSISNAEVRGAKLGCCRVEFRPSSVMPGIHSFAVGSAGSTTLVFETILLPLLLSDGESQVQFLGGTHNPMAPSYDFIKKSLMPLLEAMGFDLELKLERYGFHPQGGGLWSARLLGGTAKPLRSLRLNKRGELLRRAVHVANASLPAHVPERELATILAEPEWRTAAVCAEKVKSLGPGNIVALEMNFEHSTVMFESLAEKRLSAEAVAQRAIKKAAGFCKTSASVDEYLADQLLLPMLFAGGGCFVVSNVSSHLRTNAQLISGFTGCAIEFRTLSKNCIEVSVPSFRGA